MAAQWERFQVPCARHRMIVLCRSQRQRNGHNGVRDDRADLTSVSLDGAIGMLLPAQFKVLGAVAPDKF